MAVEKVEAVEEDPKAASKQLSIIRSKSKLGILEEDAVKTPKAPETPKVAEIEPIPYLQLFSKSDLLDRCCVVIAVIASVAEGEQPARKDRPDILIFNVVLDAQALGAQPAHTFQPCHPLTQRPV